MILWVPKFVTKAINEHKKWKFKLCKWYLAIVVLDSDDGMYIRTGLISGLTRFEEQASDI